MDNWVPAIISSALSFIGGYVLSYRNHGLAVRRDAANRRREFRALIRSIPYRFDGIHPMHFVEVYEDSVSKVREACIKIRDDIKSRKQHDFKKCWDKYCGFKRSDLELPRPPTPAGLQEYLEANKKKREEMTMILKDTLERIANLAS